MATETVGTVRELWRYPVKSMLGERVRELEITLRGTAGDRAWALRDLKTGYIVTAKRFARMLEFSAAYEDDPEPDKPRAIRIETPGGTAIHADDPGASEVISEAL